MKLKDEMFIVFTIICIIFLFLLLISHFVRREAARRKHRKQLKIKGEEGERDTAGYLKKVRGRKYLVSNLYIPGYSSTGTIKTTEIDMVLVHEKGIFVIENKNYCGWIYGDEDDANWLQVMGNRKRRYFYNPIRQNRNHMRYLKKLLEPVLDEGIPFVSVITFNQNARLKNIKLKSDDTIVCSSAKVRKCLHRYFWFRQKRIRKDKMKEIVKILEKHTDVAKRVKKEHIRNIKRYYK